MASSIHQRAVEACGHTTNTCGRAIIQHITRKSVGTRRCALSHIQPTSASDLVEGMPTVKFTFQWCSSASFFAIIFANLGRNFSFDRLELKIFCCDFHTLFSAFFHAIL
ncbi:hypothetical protein Trisim1_010583 [Trichoderma cf. simile WF8]